MPVLLLLASACATPTYHFVPDPSDHCRNRLLDSDQGESDVDCGGPDCHGCSEGQACNASSDCALNDCVLGLCQESACDDGVLDGDETGTDCGGSCDACRDGEPCTTSSDCASNVCGSDGSCATPTCTDGVRNGNELDVDCGGAVCDGCGINAPCVVAGDCQSGLCDDATNTCALNCARGTAECDGDSAEPCETNVFASPTDCGACGNVCQLEHAKSSCTGGKCQLESCVKPWIRCSTDADGCDVNGAVDRMNCGACGVVCPDLHGAPSCVDAQCMIECAAGFGDCDDNPLTGCEASTDDVENCGSCGNRCPDDMGVPNCVNGKCGVSICAAGLGDCDDDQICETDLTESADNCGRCGNHCSSSHGTARCTAGACAVEQCDAGWANCDDGGADGGFANGCETKLATDTKNCGACDARCEDIAHGSGTCDAGSCILDCQPGFADCDDDAASGCETDLTSATACGACGKTCSAATPNCVQSGTSYACQARVTLVGAAPYAVAAAAAGSLSFSVTPRAGSNRLLFLAVVSDSLTNNKSNGIAGSRPATVTFGSQSMIAAAAQAGTNDAYAPDLFSYWLALGDAATDQASVTLTITGATGPANYVVAQALQFNGAKQSAPVTASAGGFLGAPDPDDPGVTTPTLPLAASGSLIYSFLADYWDTRVCAAGTASTQCPAWSVTPSTNLTLIETMAAGPLTFYPPGTGSAPMRAFGMVVTAESPALPALGNYTPSWSDPNPGRLTHLSVVIAPAQAP